MKKGASLLFVLAVCVGLLGACRSGEPPVAVDSNPLLQSTGFNGSMALPSDYNLLPGSVTVLYPRKMDVRLVSESPSPKVSAADPAIAQAIQSILDTYQVEKATAEETEKSYCREADGSVGARQTPASTFTHVYQFPIQAQRQEIVAAFRELGLSAYATTAPWGKAGFPEPLSDDYWGPVCSVVLYTLIPEVVSE
jgi:hypothetical protein